MGLETEVIEQGRNLTVIQRKKIGLIRSICSGSDITIIDDLFSGMEAKEQIKIFTSLFIRSKNPSSIIYTTDNLDLIRKADKIVVMKHGQMVEQGKYKDLRENRNSLFYTLFCLEEEYGAIVGNFIRRSTLKKLSMISQNSNGGRGGGIAEMTPRNRRKGRFDTQRVQNFEKGKTLLKMKERAGGVPFSIWKLYIIDNKGGIVWLVILLFLITIGWLIASDWWLSIWTMGSYDFTGVQYMAIYLGICLLLVVSMIIRSVIFTKYTLRSSKDIHGRLIGAILEADFSKISKIPSGQIMNLVFRDQNDIDYILPLLLSKSFHSVFHIIGSVVILGVFVPFSIAGVVIVVLALIFFIYKFLKTNTELQRITALRSSRLMSHISEIYNPMVELKSFDFLQAAWKMFLKATDQYQNAIRHEISISTRWLSMRTAILASICLFLVIIGTSVYKLFGKTKTDHFS